MWHKTGKCWYLINVTLQLISVPEHKFQEIIFENLQFTIKYKLHKQY